MKRFTMRLAACAAAACLCAALSAKAQVPAARALTLDEYKKAKTLVIQDLEADTYVKFENAYVLDRYEMRPPYVFKYSDGIERRVYLYRLLDNKTKQPMGMVAVYYTPADGQKRNVCIPSPPSDKAVWAQYIDDLKDYAKAEAAFGSAFAYVLSRELAGLAGGGAASSAGAKSDYDVCFPASAPVTLPDGTSRPIAQVRPGDKIAAYDPATATLRTATVREVQAHHGTGYRLATVLLARETVTAGTGGALARLLTLEATPNHPVFTQRGRQAAGQLQPGDQLQVYDAATGRFEAFTVYAPVQYPAETAAKVYTLVTDTGGYLINGAAVLDK